MQRHTTDGFVKVTPVVPRPKPHSVQGPTAKVHPMTDMVMEDPTDSDHNVSYLQLKEVVTTGAVEAAAPPSQSITRADTELSLGSSLEKSSNGQALSSRGSTTTYSKRDRSSSGESKSFCKSEARGNLSPKSAALLQRRNSSISKQVSNGPRLCLLRVGTATATPTPTPCVGSRRLCCVSVSAAAACNSCLGLEPASAP